MTRAENKEQYKEYDKTYYMKHRRPKTKIGQAEQRIADLEAKLAEHNEYFTSFSCENFNEFQDFISTFMLTPHEEQTLIRELKQQIAEKDKEIEKWKTKWCDSENNSLRLYEQNLKQDQDKISFAVEQLTEVRNYVKECWGLDELEGKVRLDIAKKIRLQIEKLKKGVE